MSQAITVRTASGYGVRVNNQVIPCHNLATAVSETKRINDVAIAKRDNLAKVLGVDPDTLTAPVLSSY